MLVVATGYRLTGVVLPGCLEYCLTIGSHRVIGSTSLQVQVTQLSDFAALLVGCVLSIVFAHYLRIWLCALRSVESCYPSVELLRFSMLGLAEVGHCLSVIFGRAILELEFAYASIGLMRFYA